MSVIIGIDPHKRLHAACAIDETEREVAQLQVTAGECQLEELLELGGTVRDADVGDRIGGRARLSVGSATHRCR